MRLLLFEFFTHSFSPLFCSINWSGPNVFFVWLRNKLEPALFIEDSFPPTNDKREMQLEIPNYKNYHSLQIKAYVSNHKRVFCLIFANVFVNWSTQISVIYQHRNLSLEFFKNDSTYIRTTALNNYLETTLTICRWWLMSFQQIITKNIYFCENLSYFGYPHHLLNYLKDHDFVLMNEHLCELSGVVTKNIL